MYFEYIHSEIIDDRIDAQFFTPEYIKSLKKINQFRIETLGNISRRIFDPPHTAPEFVDKSDFEMIMIENITLNGIEGNFRAISETCHKDIFKNSHLEGNELLVSRVGNSSGTFASVFPCYKGKNVSGNISIIKLKDEIIDKEYAFAYFNSNIGQNSIKRNIANTARKFLTISKIREFQVPIPSPEIQKYIGDKVRKAEVLREEAKRLKKEAEEIFNQNYEVISKNNSKFEWVSSYYLNEDNVIPNFYKQYQLLRDKKYVYIEFENIVESIKCGIPVRSDMRIGDIYPFYGASGVTDNIGNYNFDGEYLIVAQDGSIGSVNVARNKFWANNHVWVVKVKNGWDLEFLELYLNQYNYWISLTTGSVVPKVTSENLKKLLVPKINYEIQKSIGDKIREAKHKEQRSKALIEQAKQDVEDLIEDNFSMK